MTEVILDLLGSTDDLLDQRQGIIDRNGKADAFDGSRGDLGIGDPDDLALGIEEGSA